jgi:tetratricopeptide (TPR) repeat protein
MADNFGVWKFNQAEDFLIEALKDSAASVRRFAIRSLMTIKSAKALPIAPDFAVNDRSEDVRRVATYFMTRVKGDIEPYSYLMQVLEFDSMPSVRVAAAEGLGYVQNPDAIALLQKVAKSNDVYVQRACGKALAELYQIEGIEILIKSLSFPSIDAFYNYDRNVPNFLAAYTNFDFPEEQRYDQARWQKWFDKNKSKIDLRQNVDAYRAFTELNDSLRNKSNEEQIQKYEELFKKYPNYQSIRKALAQKLNEVAWSMVTAAKETKDHNPETGLKYAKRATELISDPNYFDTLAEALLANGQIEESLKLCQEMLKKYPNEKMFSERIKKLQK